jgi:hypothetical protein
MKNNSAQKRPVKGDHPVYFINKAVSLFSYSMAAALLLISCNTVKDSADNHDIIGQDYVYMRIASNGK